MLMRMVIRMILILICVNANDSHSLLRMGMIINCVLMLHENANGCQVESRIILISFFGYSFIPLS